ncbi:hypothetical protein BCR44DRAFT_1458716 [Catenaria anguillulae PL171]|uniref:Uncharacterized protein n=1 Tax=Catenaria anguillulae PL171 TaxID=765915 RepID=A0A1Y2HYJ4_9FUNG|nr:hypothetical protein BCR44DRAFT_1458716 [Catenaria anguillulae PL171]
MSPTTPLPASDLDALMAPALKEPSLPSPQPPIRPFVKWRRRVILVGTLLSVFSSAGLASGFSPLKSMMLRERVFDYLCLPGQDTCNGQVLRMDLMYTLSGAIGSFLVVPTGFLLVRYHYRDHDRILHNRTDRLGPKLLYLFAAVMLAFSLVMFGIGIVLGGAAQNIIIVAFIVMSASGSALYTASFHVANLVPERSAVITLMLNLIYTSMATETERTTLFRTFFFAFTAPPVLVFVFGLFFMPLKSITPVDEWLESNKVSPEENVIPDGGLGDIFASASTGVVDTSIQHATITSFEFSACDRSPYSFWPPLNDKLDRRTHATVHYSILARASFQPATQRLEWSSRYDNPPTLFWEHNPETTQRHTTSWNKPVGCNYWSPTFLARRPAQGVYNCSSRNRRDSKHSSTSGYLECRSSRNWHDSPGNGHSTVIVSTGNCKRQCHDLTGPMKKNPSFGNLLMSMTDILAEDAQSQSAQDPAAESIKENAKVSFKRPSNNVLGAASRSLGSLNALGRVGRKKGSAIKGRRHSHRLQLRNTKDRVPEQPRGSQRTWYSLKSTQRSSQCLATGQVG